jgi:copper oxidase (laccase) domain-containing protein
VKQGSRPQDLQVFIGPHIQKRSFEIGSEVRDQILTSLGPLSPEERQEYFDRISAEKVLLDLHKVVLTQLSQSGIQQDNVHSLFIDTMTDLRFHSHRRDKEKAGRQLSFISRTS